MLTKLASQIPSRSEVGPLARCLGRVYGQVAREDLVAESPRPGARVPHLTLITCSAKTS